MVRRQIIIMIVVTSFVCGHASLSSIILSLIRLISSISFVRSSRRIILTPILSLVSP